MKRVVRVKLLPTPEQRDALVGTIAKVADTNAAINTARRGVEGWAAVNRPHAARNDTASAGPVLQAPSIRAR